VPCVRSTPTDWLQVANSFKPQPAYRTWGAVPRKAPLLSLGIGGSLALDGGLCPAMRIRFQDWLTVKVRWGGMPARDWARQHDAWGGAASILWHCEVSRQRG
jgi:hypothetical protein